MSSTAYPFGMVPVENIGAGYNTQGFETFGILDGYATSIYFGDVVKMDTSGVIQKDVGTAALTPYGVFLGCSYIANGTGYFLTAQSWPASTTTAVTTGPGRPLCKVSTNPSGVFMMQADGSVPLTALGANAAIVQTAGTAAIGKSRNALGASTIATTSSLPLRIVGLAEIPDNDWGDAFTIVLVKFNNHQLNTLTGI